jgi:putative ABC transport system permease protein
MKNPILLLAIAALLFAGCRDKKSNEHEHDGEAAHDHTEGVHKHEDGSEHEDHQDTEHTQEEFRVGSDSISNKTEVHDHEGEHGHQH